MIDWFFGLLILSAINCALITIITESDLMQPLRDLADNADPPLNMLGELVSCPLCTATWVGLGIAVPTALRLDYSTFDSLLAFGTISMATVTGGLGLKRLIGW